jgi:O-antigen/teichoic acid export membrane protein
LQFLNYRLDQFVVAGLGTRSDVGIYAVAVGLSETVWWIANAVALALLPRLTRMDADKGAEVTSVACRNTLALAAVAAAGVGGVSLVAVRMLFGDAFSPATWAILWLMPGIVALSGAKVLTSYIFSQGKMAVNSLIALVALGGTLLFDVFLIPRFGINGAAAASSLAYVMTLILALYFYQRLSRNSFLNCLLLRSSDLRLYSDLARRARRRMAAGAIAGSGL